MEITSNPIEKTHTIYVPPHDVEWRDIEYLHELGHAYLAETVHPLFSSAYFSKGTPDELASVKPVVDILRSIRPGNPSLRNLRRLTNRLAALVTKHQLVVTTYDGIDVWRVL